MHRIISWWQTECHTVWCWLAPPAPPITFHVTIWKSGGDRKYTYQNKPTWPNNSFLCQSHRYAVYNAASLNTYSLSCKSWHQLLLWHSESSSWTQLCAVNSTVWTQNKLFFFTLHPFWWNMISPCFHPFTISDPLHKMESLAISITPHVSGATLFYWHITFQLHSTQVWQLRKRNQMKP